MGSYITFIIYLKSAAEGILTASWKCIIRELVNWLMDCFLMEGIILYMMYILPSVHSPAMVFFLPLPRWHSRIECTVCSHSWYQARDRLFTLNDQHELVPAPDHHLSRVASNIAADREPSYAGEYKLYVGNLDFYTTAEQLRATFAEKGEVGDVNIITGEDGRSRGFAFVTMMTEEGGKKAEELDGEDVGGRNLVVRPPNN